MKTINKVEDFDPEYWGADFTSKVCLLSGWIGIGKISNEMVRLAFSDLQNEIIEHEKLLSETINKFLRKVN